MNLNLFGIALFCMFCIMFNGAVYDIAYGVSENQHCSVQINSIDGVSPVTLDDNTRSNPDGSAYPGDAIHFLFKFSGSDTCTSFLVNPLVGSKNIVLKSSLVISDGDINPKAHEVILYEWVPKYLQTFHYYKILNSETVTHTQKGGKQTSNTTYTLSENPIVSIREDKEPTSSQLQKIKKYKSHYLRDDIRMIVTESWHLVQEQRKYNVGVDEHVLEDRDSVNRFVNFVKNHCSNLSENHGCVFGHAEIDTEINNDEQMCLFEELDKLGIKYDGTVETNQCISVMLENKIGTSVKGTGISCNGDGKCKSYVRTDSDGVTPHILHPYGDIFFKYLEIYDSDGFYYHNNDGTYYLDDVIGIHSIPDAAFKKERAGIMTFDNSIIDNTIEIISDVSCGDSLCDVKLSGDKISPSTHNVHNGDMVSTHYTHDKLGLASITHESMMYNLDRYIGVYHSIATPLVVCYDPVISDVSFWSYLADAGNTSFENRYAAAIKYDGSIGGCADDPDGLYKDRRVKITDFFTPFVQTDNFQNIAAVSIPDVILSNANSIADMSILDSVKSKMTNSSIADSYSGPLVSINHTIQDVQIDSAGFSRLLFEVSLEEDYLEKNYINVTAFNTFGSSDFGGADILYLAHGTYDYPWGFFSTPFNVTAYTYLKENIPCEEEFCDENTSIASADTDVTIHLVKFSDSVDDSVGFVDFYLNYHGADEEFAYMHMADLYDMNVQQNINSYSGEFLLNKTAIYYDKKMQSYLFDNNLYENNTQFDSVEKYLINQHPRVFTEGLYSVDAQISASRDHEEINLIAFDDLYMKYPIEYYLNMHPDNYLDIKRATTAVSIPHYVHFGEITSVTINDAPAKNISCNGGCVVILSNDLPIDITAQNIWGGQLSNHNLTSIQRVPYDETLWIELLPLRLFWIFFALALLYVSYRAVRMILSRRK
jgi:hypothetical protein